MKGQKREVMRGRVGSGDKGMQVPAGATRGKDTPWKPPETLLQAGTLIPPSEIHIRYLKNCEIICMVFSH